jgi:hypothetical protein
MCFFSFSFEFISKMLIFSKSFGGFAKNCYFCIVKTIIKWRQFSQECEKGNRSKSFANISSLLTCCTTNSYKWCSFKIPVFDIKKHGDLRKKEAITSKLTQTYIELYAQKNNRHNNYNTFNCKFCDSNLVLF